jgi:hypothetical protein
MESDTLQLLAKIRSKASQLLAELPSFDVAEAESVRLTDVLARLATAAAAAKSARDIENNIRMCDRYLLDDIDPYSQVSARLSDILRDFDDLLRTEERAKRNAP